MVIRYYQHVNYSAAFKIQHLSSLNNILNSTLNIPFTDLYKKNCFVIITMTVVLIQVVYCSIRESLSSVIINIFCFIQEGSVSAAYQWCQAWLTSYSYNWLVKHIYMLY